MWKAKLLIITNKLYILMLFYKIKIIIIFSNIKIIKYKMETKFIINNQYKILVMELMKLVNKYLFKIKYIYLILKNQRIYK